MAQHNQELSTCEDPHNNLIHPSRPHAEPQLLIQQEGVYHVDKPPIGWLRCSAPCDSAVSMGDKLTSYTDRPQH